MRIAGALTLMASFMAAVVFALLPVSVDVGFASESCGAPVVEVVDGVTTDADDQDPAGAACYDASLPRVFVAVGLLLVGATGGVVMLALGRTE